MKMIQIATLTLCGVVSALTLRIEAQDPEESELDARGRVVRRRGGDLTGEEGADRSVDECRERPITGSGPGVAD